MAKTENDPRGGFECCQNTVVGAGGGGACTVCRQGEDRIWTKKLSIHGTEGGLCAIGRGLGRRTWACDYNSHPTGPIMSYVNVRCMYLPYTAPSPSASKGQNNVYKHPHKRTARKAQGTTFNEHTMCTNAHCTTHNALAQPRQSGNNYSTRRVHAHEYMQCMCTSICA